MRWIVALLLGLALLGQSPLTWAESDSQESTLQQVGYGTGSVIGSAVYFPFKASFCILGAIGSGFTYIFAGAQTADKVISSACRGTWAITPDVVKGKEPVQFVGDPPGPNTRPKQQAGPGK